MFGVALSGIALSGIAVQADTSRAADLDADGDQDLLAAAFLGHQVAWFENRDGGYTRIVKLGRRLGDAGERPQHRRFARHHVDAMGEQFTGSGDDIRSQIMLARR